MPREEEEEEEAQRRLLARGLVERGEPQSAPIQRAKTRDPEVVGMARVHQQAKEIRQAIVFGEKKHPSEYSITPHASLQHRLSSGTASLLRFPV